MLRDDILFSGDPIHLDCGLIINQSSFGEIKNNITYKSYEEMVIAMTRYPYEFKFDLEDQGIDYTTKNTFDMFLMLNDFSTDSKIDEMCEILNFMFCHKYKNKYIRENFDINSKDNELYFKSRLSGNIIDKNTIEEIKKAFMKIHYMQVPKERKPVGEMAKEMVKMDIVMKRKEKPKYDIYSIMDGLIWTGGVYTYKTILELTPHQIYRSYMKVNRVKTYDFYMQGVYHGIIDSKELNKRISKIDWINKD